VYKLGKTHVIIDSLLRLLDITKPTSVLDQTIYASLFYVEPQWLKDVKDFFRMGYIESMLLVQ
jgi:hypothetical protein